MQECVLPQEEAVVPARLVVGWLIVTNSSGGVIPSTVCGEDTTGESRWSVKAGKLNKTTRGSSSS